MSNEFAITDRKLICELEATLDGLDAYNRAWAEEIIRNVNASLDAGCLASMKELHSISTLLATA